MPVAQPKEPTARHGSGPSGPECWRIELSHAPSAVPPARAPAGAALRDLRATADHVTAALFAAELVANAVAHTRGPGPVALVVRARAAGCEVEVHGADPTPVVGLLAAACDAERTGRAAGPAAGSSGPRSVSARRSSGGGCGWCGG